MIKSPNPNLTEKAIDFISMKLKSYGLEQVEVIQIPTDGKTM